MRQRLPKADAASPLPSRQSPCWRPAAATTTTCNNNADDYDGTEAEVATGRGRLRQRRAATATATRSATRSSPRSSAQNVEKEAGQSCASEVERQPSRGRYELEVDTLEVNGDTATVERHRPGRRRIRDPHPEGRLGLAHRERHATADRTAAVQTSERKTTRLSLVGAAALPMLAQMPGAHPDPAQSVHPCREPEHSTDMVTFGLPHMLEDAMTIAATRTPSPLAC